MVGLTPGHGDRPIGNRVPYPRHPLNDSIRQPPPADPPASSGGGGGGCPMAAARFAGLIAITATMVALAVR